VLSYNVLLPNSVDGWWTYKMYAPGTIADPSEASWPRRSALLRDAIRSADADVVCLQEVSAGSFEEDFRWMSEELGYVGCELFKKGRFRPATFWRPSAVSLVSASHRDRCIVTAFALEPTAADAAAPTHADVSVINCHLQAGPEGARRLRQVLDAVEAAAKGAKKAGVSDPSKVALVVCGDLNGDERSAAVRLLEDGLVEPSFAEDDGVAVTSKVKKLPVPPLVDCAAAVGDRPPPPTLVVAELISLLVEGASDQGRAARLSKGAEAALRAAFDQLAAGKPTMDAAAVERWLVRVNGQVGRGSEFRKALAEMGGGAAQPVQGAPAAAAAEGNDAADEPEAGASAPSAAPPSIPPDGQLTWAGFQAVYNAELQAGKFWGVGYDLYALGWPPEGLGKTGVFTARYDRVYASVALEVVAVRDCVSESPCPNSEQPSDHLPVGVALRLRN
jgi:endonuclease/exonuclease/phosphatase family metal-dependent hydrolase